MKKVQIEVLLAGAEIGGIKLQPYLVKTTRLVTVDMICPRAAIARKTVAKEVKFQKAKADVKGQCWTERVMHREDVDGHFGLAVQVSEVLDDEWFEKFLRATAKIALKEFRDLAKSYTIGIGDIAKKFGLSRNSVSQIKTRIERRIVAAGREMIAKEEL